MIVFLTEILLPSDFETFPDIFHGLISDTCAAMDRRAHCQPSYKNESGSKNLPGSQAGDPIAIPDDDELDAMEINYIDLENNNRALTRGHWIAPTQESAAALHDLGFQSLAESRSHCKHTQGPDSVRHTEDVTRPLFRALTKDDLLASGAQPSPETHGVGFKAWYETGGPHHTGNAAPGMQRKENRQKPPITLNNRERVKNTARAYRDAPQFAMSVLKPNRKRTIGELSYNELIAPAQIESPLERSARRARRLRQRQERCDSWSHNTSAADARGEKDVDYVHSHEYDSTAGEKVDLAVSPILNEPLDRRATIPRVGDKRREPLGVYEPSPAVSTYTLAKGEEAHTSMQRCEVYSECNEEVFGICSTQITAQKHDPQDHGHGENAPHSGADANTEPKYRKPRIRGPTDVCGVFSPEKKPPVKRSTSGEFHCPRCDSQFTTSSSVNFHFETCIAKYGNPRSLRWNDHPSLEKEGKSIVSMKNETMVTVPARLQDIPGDAANNTHDTEPVCGFVTNNNMVGPSSTSNIQAPGRSKLAETRSIIEEPAPVSGIEVKPDQQALTTEYRATAGKSLSAEILKHFRETGSWDRGIELDESVHEAQDDETEVPNVTYRYSVSKREWLESEENAVELKMGPYHTLNEANAVANAAVQCPQTDQVEGIQSQGWSYYYRQDEHGMQFHMATVLGMHIEAAVRRGKYYFIILIPWPIGLMWLQSLRRPMNGVRSPCPPSLCPSAFT